MKLLTAALCSQFYEELLEHVLPDLAWLGRCGIYFKSRDRSAVLRALKKAGWHHVRQRKGIKLFAKNGQDWPLEITKSGMWLMHNYDSLNTGRALEAIRGIFKFSDVNSAGAQTWRAFEPAIAEIAKVRKTVQDYSGDLKVTAHYTMGWLWLTMVPSIRSAA